MSAEDSVGQALGVSGASAFCSGLPLWTRASASALPHLPGEVSNRRAHADQVDAKENPDQPQGRDRQVRPQDQRQRIPTSPLASTQPQFGKGRIVSAKTTFEMPSIMKKTIRSSAIVISPCAGSRRNRHPISTAKMTEISWSQKCGTWQAPIKLRPCTIPLMM